MILTKEELERRALEQKKKANGFELIAKQELHKRGWKYYYWQYPFYYYIFDFMIPEKMLIVEIDGGSHEERTVKDAKRDKFCNECGFRVVRIPSHRASHILEYVDKYNTFVGWEKLLRKAHATGKEKKSFIDRKYINQAIELNKPVKFYYGGKAKSIKPKKQYKK